jgi:hypothetical protein
VCTGSFQAAFLLIPVIMVIQTLIIWASSPENAGKEFDEMVVGQFEGSNQRKPRGRRGGKAPIAVVPGRLAVTPKADDRPSAAVADPMSAKGGCRSARKREGLSVPGAATFLDLPTRKDRSLSELL